MVNDERKQQLTTTKKNKGGRPPGSVNQRTKDIRQAFKEVIEANTENFKEWVRRVAATDPARAADLMIRMAEYIIPKLERVEHTGEGGGPIRTEDVTLYSDEQLISQLAAVRAQLAGGKDPRRDASETGSPPAAN
jgi:hypothetical protein